jgi:acyl carrier protein
MSWLNHISESEQKRGKLEQIFAGREPLDDQKLWKIYFEQYGVAPETVVRIRQILTEILEADLSRIRDTDDFSKELALFWEFDSLADVEVVQEIEMRFGIAITDEEAAAMKTLKDIVLGVHAKISKSG